MAGELTYSSDMLAFRQKFEQYRRLNSKSLKEALVHQATNLAWDLYKTTKALGPTKAFIMGIPERNGYRIRRPRGWAVFDMPAPPKRKGESEKQRRKRKQTWDFKPGEMNRRVRGIGVTARGWLPRYWEGNPHWRLRRIGRPKGFVEMNLEGANMSITLVNRMPGMPGMEAKHGIISMALQRRIADMGVYIDRKLKEAASQSGFSNT